jgi:hypothetical protein
MIRGFRRVDLAYASGPGRMQAHDSVRVEFGRCVRLEFLERTHRATRVQIRNGSLAAERAPAGPPSRSIWARPRGAGPQSSISTVGPVSRGILRAHPAVARAGRTCRLTAAGCAPSMPLSWAGVPRPVRWLLMCSVASALAELQEGPCLAMADYVTGPEASREATAAGGASVAYPLTLRGRCARVG